MSEADKLELVGYMMKPTFMRLMSDEPAPDNLIDLLRSAGYDAHDFLPGETLPEFLKRTGHEQEP